MTSSQVWQEYAKVWCDILGQPPLPHPHGSRPCWHILVVMCVNTLRTAVCVNTLRNTGAFFHSLGGFFPLSINTLITLKWLSFCDSKQEPNSGIKATKQRLSRNATSEQQGDDSHKQFVCAICGGIFLLLQNKFMRVFLLSAVSVVFFLCFQVNSILLKISLSLLQLSSVRLLHIH